jgi:hypothetical protein
MRPGAVSWPGRLSVAQAESRSGRYTPSSPSGLYGESNARRENGSGKEAVIQASGRKGSYRQARSRSSHHEDLSAPSGALAAGPHPADPAKTRAPGQRVMMSIIAGRVPDDPAWIARVASRQLGVSGPEFTARWATLPRRSPPQWIKYRAILPPASSRSDGRPSVPSLHIIGQMQGWLRRQSSGDSVCDGERVCGARGLRPRFSGRPRSSPARFR